ncbi:histidine acid phosphatase family protein (macronuclear) [Tetrahymena thermophila SB210]|uniref:Histidine acid phosphatase family protein n=1 Tax=Tetrahymena thermophila (strain SB210) TaxID=312017 RepID=I7MCQ9_TETTS|nr:histidine acid phosphatase family protein [Tetrahymena thermophila SB210]EAR84653.1 histidine acid phosphatase family protein [Tetrahymena thermophila SB210]|eukprot:XP_001032316.1 histidine acid phosphatase family protein [Tetrahymena thermophila SB210]
MTKKISSTFLLLLLALAFANAELKFVFQLYRHGARGPINDWFNGGEQKDIYNELTPTGERQHYNLGSKMREEYKGFLPSKFNHSEIYVRSTDMNRTLMSAASHLQGMFPENTGDFLPSNLTDNYTLPYFAGAKNYLPNQKTALPHNIQVVPIHTQPKKGDLVLQPDSNCQYYDDIRLAFYAQKKETIDFITQQFNTTYQQYSLLANKTFSNFDDMEDVDDTLQCNRYNAKWVPQISQELKANATYLSSLAWNFWYNQPELLRALNTPFLNQLMDYLNPVVQGKNVNGLKWVMFSAHDTNVQLISAALNLTSIDCLLHKRFPDKFKPSTPYYNCEFAPEFASSLIFELYQADVKVDEQINKGDFYIRLRRDGKYMNLCERNSTLCSMKEFTQRVSWFAYDFNAVCNTPPSKAVLSTQIITQSHNPQADQTNFFEIGFYLQSIVIILGGFAFYRSNLNKKKLEFKQFSDCEVGLTH